MKMSTGKKNILLLVIDQFRADCVFGALAPFVNLPNIRALAADGIAFLNHYSVTSPCGPSRVSLFTGQYAMNHRAVRNGTPQRADTPTLAGVARDAGFDPLLFGYTDTAMDPRHLSPDDPRLFSYEELSPGFNEVVRMRLETDVTAWEDHLKAKGYSLPPRGEMYKPIGSHPDDPAFYAAEDSDTAFLTDKTLEDLSGRPPGWFACVTYLRPHPPFVAPAPYNQMYDPTNLPAPQPISAAEDHPFLGPARRTKPIQDTLVGFPDFAPTEENAKLLRALYFGLATEVDHHVGRLINWLKTSGQYDNTMVVLTADHGEMLGDYGLWQKASYHDAAFHVPLIVRDPGAHKGLEVDAPTESIDVAPTILEMIGATIPHSMDGASLLPFLKGEAPRDWRPHSYSELDFGNPVKPTIWQAELGLALDQCNLSVLRRGSERLVHFGGDLPQILFSTDGSVCMDNAENNDKKLDLSRAMLCHRMVHAEGTFSRTMITSDGVKTATT